MINLPDSNTSVVEEESISKSPLYKQGRKKLLNNNLTVSLDVEKLSDRVNLQ